MMLFDIHMATLPEDVRDMECARMVISDRKRQLLRNAVIKSLQENGESEFESIETILYFIIRLNFDLGLNSRVLKMAYSGLANELSLQQILGHLQPTVSCSDICWTLDHNSMFRELVLDPKIAGEKARPGSALNRAALALSKVRDQEKYGEIYARQEQEYRQHVILDLLKKLKLVAL